MEIQCNKFILKYLEKYFLVSAAKDKLKTISKWQEKSCKAVLHVCSPRGATEF